MINDNQTVRQYIATKWKQLLQDLTDVISKYENEDIPNLPVDPKKLQSIFS